MSTALLAAVAVILCILFRILNVNSQPQKPALYCKDLSFLDTILKIAPLLQEPYVTWMNYHILWIKIKALKENKLQRSTISLLLSNSVPVMVSIWQLYITTICHSYHIRLSEIMAIKMYRNIYHNRKWYASTDDALNIHSKSYRHYITILSLLKRYRTLNWLVLKYIVMFVN